MNGAPKKEASPTLWLGVSLTTGSRRGQSRRTTSTLARREHARYACADAVIGADGINSTMRSVVEANDELRDCDRTAWRVVIPNYDGAVSQTWLTVSGCS